MKEFINEVIHHTTEIVSVLDYIADATHSRVYAHNMYIRLCIHTHMDGQSLT